MYLKWFLHRRENITCCCCRQRWRFEKMGGFLLKLHCSVKSLDPNRVCERTLTIMFCCRQPRYFGSYLCCAAQGDQVMYRHITVACHKLHQCNGSFTLVTCVSETAGDSDRRCNLSVLPFATLGSATQIGSFLLGQVSN
jgi:hypothetical protein